MTNPVRNPALQAIFSIFLGLMLTTFIGVGVYTFHAPPQDEIDPQIRELSSQEEDIRSSQPAGELTPEDRDRIQELRDQRNELNDAALKARQRWAMSTSIILIVLATLAMAVSLLLPQNLPVIANGVLLGGVFSMLYGTGWVIAAESSIIRFIVMSVALVITVGLGYVRFARRPTRADPEMASTAAAVGGEEVQSRLADLERRLDAAASELGRRS